MPHMILLGAGASQEAGVPTSYDMTKAIVKKFRSAQSNDQHAKAISFVTGGLLFQQGVRNQNPFDGVDVEELFNAVLLLAKRDSLEAAPFISAWHPFIDEMDRIVYPRASADRLGRVIYSLITQTMIKSFPSAGPPFKADEINKALMSAIKEAIGRASRNQPFSLFNFSSQVGRKIEECIQGFIKKWGQEIKNHTPQNFREMEDELKKILDQEKDKPGQGAIFQDVAQAMIDMLADIVWIEDSQKVEYLIPILRLLAHEGKLTIATLNYDNSIELMAEANHITVESGIERWSATGSITPPENGLFLLKLHGSIDWLLEPRESPQDSPMPQWGIRKVSIDEVRRSGYRPAVIFGQRNKLTADGPFLDLLRVFKEELGKANNLIVVGFSFRDDHINTMISQWLNQSRGNRLQIIDPYFEKSTVPFVLELLGHARARLDLVPQIASLGLQKMFGNWPETLTFNLIGDVQYPANPTLFDVPQIALDGQE